MTESGKDEVRNGEAGGPVIHDRRRIDPLTGQVRHGKHAASRPAGTPGAARPGPPPAPPAAPAEDAAPIDVADAAGSAADGVPVSEAKGRPASEPEAASVPGLRSDEGATREGADTKRPEVSEPISTAREREKELTDDLQRLQAEYVNYRKRVDRDRELVKEQAIAVTLSGLLPVLDAIDQAREHGELSGGFKSVADSLQAALGRLGLITYGEKGDTFDPKIHEALTYSYSPDVTEDSCVEILQPGYMVGEKILRPARVAVAAPATGPDGASVVSDDGPQAADGTPDVEGN